MDPEPGVEPPPREPAPGRRWRRLATAARLGLGVLVVATAWLTFLAPPPTIQLSARTEEIRIYKGRSVPMPGVPFARALLAREDSVIPLTGVVVELEDTVMLRLYRITPDTLYLQVQSPPGTSAGLVRAGERTLRTLGDDTELRVPLREGGPGGTFRLGFRARSVEVGHEAGFPTTQRTPLLLSGQVTLEDRTVSRVAFQAVSRTLRVGDRIDVPAGAHRGDGSGYVLVDGRAGMSVGFAIRAPDARISNDDREERLGTAFFDRIGNDPVLATCWVLVLFLVLQPAGSVVADRMKQAVERYFSQ